MDIYADGDSVTFRLTLTDEWGDLVDADSATVSVRRCRSTQQKDWNAGTQVLAPTALENLELGSYRYSWSTSGCDAGRYAAEAIVIRAGITNKERLLVTLK